MKKLIYLMCAGVMAVCASCSSDNGPDNPTGDDKPESNESEINTESRGLELSEAELEMVQVHNKFAQKFFDFTLENQQGSNIIISPLSALCNISFVANAADMDSRRALLELVGQPDIDKLNELNAKLLRELDKRDTDNVQISLANSVWLNKSQGTSISDEFKKIAAEYYFAPTTLLSFDGSTYEILNEWAEKKTNGLIKNFYKQNEISSFTVAVLMNALYFKGIFAESFDKDLTYESKFKAEDGSLSDVQMMNGTMEVPYYDNSKVKAISLVFGKGSYELVVALPKKDVSLSAAAGGLLTLGTPEKHLVAISMPKFETATEIYFDDFYAKNGIGEGMNFSSLITAYGPLVNADIKTKQKTVIKIYEEGAEGASVTGTQVEGVMPDNYSFTADRPFVYMIREKTSGAILFMGAYVK